MTVIVLERVQITVRGELSRWMLEPKTGVFVGRVSALVRDKLWDLISRRQARAVRCWCITQTPSKGSPCAHSVISNGH